MDVINAPAERGCGSGVSTSEKSMAAAGGRAGSCPPPSLSPPPDLQGRECGTTSSPSPPPLPGPSFTKTARAPFSPFPLQ